VCTDTEFAVVAPPAGQTCAQYLGDFVSAAGGYVNNGDATADCQFCQYRTGDEVSCPPTKKGAILTCRQYLRTVGYAYSHRARNVGIIIAYILFNVSACLNVCSGP
jgi:ATP-binding cassette subfamily G (WHITE) protein 2 (SNQ2)